MERRASCSCGRLAVVVAGDIVRTSICHCYACQKRTGSVFGAQTRVPRERATIVGASTAYDRPTDEGDHVRFHFCPTCGATVYWEIPDLPESVIVPVGAFEDPTTLPAPVMSVYEARRHAWVQLPGSIIDHWD
jgi:hypothetical protein